MNAPSPLPAKPTLVVGLDGLGPERSKRLAADGQLPTISRWVKQGQAFRFTSTEPNDPTVLWADLAAGTPAVYHGVLAGATLDADGLRSVTQGDWGCPPLWQTAAEAGRRSAVVNWPGSSPSPSVPSSVSSGLVTAVSDVELNEPPAKAPEARDERRLDVNDITVSLVAELVGPFATVVKGWSPNDRRIVCLRAALARAATIQNAALDAIHASHNRPLELLWVRYDLVETLARVLLPRPGTFFYDGHDTPDGFEDALLDRASALVDTMLDAVWSAMPPGTAVLAVGLLDYAADRFLDNREAADTTGPKNTFMDGVVIRRDQRSLLATQRSGGFATWVDPDWPVAADAPVHPAVIHELQRWPRERLGVEATPRRRADSAEVLIGLTPAVELRRAEQSLRLTDSSPLDRAAEDAALERRALNLARAATAHRRWHTAADAWRILIDLQDRFLHHLGLLDALLHAGLLDEFDRRMEAWLRRLPDHRWLRSLADVRGKREPPRKFPGPEYESLYTREHAADLTAPPTPWLDLSPDGWDACLRDNAVALAACHAAYRRFASAWRDAGIDTYRPVSTPTSSEPNPRGAALRHARALAGPQSFGARHTSPEEQSMEVSAERATALDQYSALSEDWLMELHRSQYRSPDRVPHAGCYRGQDYEAGSLSVGLDGEAITGDTFAPAARLPGLTGSMLDLTRRWIARDPEAGPVIAPLTLLAFLKIHAFADGNGRTGRDLYRHVLRATGFGLVDRLDLNQWFERRRELYLAHLSLIPHSGPHTLEPAMRQRYLNAYLDWSLDFLTQAIDHATRCVETLRAGDPANPSDS